MDLCVLYGANNGPLLSKMISNIFTQQPKYHHDLAEILPTIMQVHILLHASKGGGWQKNFVTPPYVYYNFIIIYNFYYRNIL